MELLDLLDTLSLPPEVDVDNLRELYGSEIVVNVAGFLLPIENVTIRDGKIVIVISASSLEDRQIEIHLEK